MANFPKIPGYEISSVLGEGGVATVYLGFQLKLNRKVAIKILKPFMMKDKETVSRFEREAKVAAMLSHSNIIQVYDTGKSGQHHYIVMEYMEESLKDRMKLNPNGTINPKAALDIVENMMKALDYAHFRGVYHRDIKPENIMFRQDSTPVLLDFGIARVFDSFEKLTRSGVLMGTAYYMSPEQAKALKEVDGRSDVYSLGAVLFEMLTGIKPYDGNTPVAVALAHILEPIPLLPRDLECYQPLIEQMMAKDKKKRISSAPEYRQLLDSIDTAPESFLL